MTVPVCQAPKDAYRLEPVCLKPSCAADDELSCCGRRFQQPTVFCNSLLTFGHTRKPIVCISL